MSWENVPEPVFSFHRDREKSPCAGRKWLNLLFVHHRIRPKLKVDGNKCQASHPPPSDPTETNSRRKIVPLSSSVNPQGCDSSIYIEKILSRWTPFSHFSLSSTSRINKFLCRWKIFQPLSVVDTIDASIISARMETTAFSDTLPAFHSIHAEKISWSMESTCPV